MSGKEGFLEEETLRDLEDKVTRQKRESYLGQWEWYVQK